MLACPGRYGGIAMFTGCGSIKVMHRFCKADDVVSITIHSSNYLKEKMRLQIEHNMYSGMCHLNPWVELNEEASEELLALLKKSNTTKNKVLLRDFKGISRDWGYSISEVRNKSIDSEKLIIINNLYIEKIIYIETTKKLTNTYYNFSPEVMEFITNIFNAMIEDKE